MYTPTPANMKKDIHPTNYRPVVFQDLNEGTTFLTRSTVETDETIKLEGVEYPLVKVHISSASHPFFTGQEKLLDIEGRVDKFKARQKAAKSQAEAMKAKASKVRKKTPKADETDTAKIGSSKKPSSKR
jgi:large subunit ribosomal protein L31